MFSLLLYVVLCSLLLFSQDIEGTVECDLGTSKNVDSAFKNCCAKAKSGETTRLVVNKDVDDVGPFSFHCNNAELHLSTGVTMTSSTSTSDFSGAKGWINCVGMHDIAITGAGTFDGQGKKWWNGASNQHSLLFFQNVKRVTMEDVTYINSPHFTLHLNPVYDSIVNNVTVINPYESNLDCIDLGGDNNVVKHCNLICGDDNIAIKEDGTNMVIESCSFGTGHGASIGSVTDGTIKNITFSGITMKNTINGARIKTQKGFSGGAVSYVTFKHFNMKKINHEMEIQPLYGVPEYATEKFLKNLSPAYRDYFVEKWKKKQPFYDPSPRSSSAKITQISFTDINATSNVGGDSPMWCNENQICTHISYKNIDIDGEASCKYIKEGTRKGKVSPSGLYKSSSCSFSSE